MCIGIHFINSENDNEAMFTKILLLLRPRNLRCNGVAELSLLDDICNYAVSS
jgi:hypothetical protein